jgi:hypothetical protein
MEGYSHMQTNSRLFDDFARLASSAVGTAQGVKTECENLFRQRMERLMADMDLVPREEFDAIKAMAISLEATVEAQGMRIAELEKGLAAAKSPAAPRKTATKKAGKTPPRNPS